MTRGYISIYPPARMLVPIDGTPGSILAMDQIFDLARLIGASMNILHIAVLGEKPTPEAGAITSPIYLDYPQFDWPAWAKEFMERFYEYLPPGVKLNLFHREGEPVDVLLKFASEQGEGIIALSWRGHLEGERAITIKGILQKTEFPVLLVRSKE